MSILVYTFDLLYMDLCIQENWVIGYMFMFSVCGQCHQCSQEAMPFYMSISTTQHSSCFLSLSTLASSHLNFSLLGAVSHCGFNFHFPE